ncbi:phospholipase effector Tle1 domain-containing protein [Nocardia sp. NBC_00565]|uniref:phospholipase effector Tle1 domain-containing protein n=1 Tax=Nocardia sp. NBC_00565 TaxID=2975993 RepID=UPI003FA56EEF
MPVGGRNRERWSVRLAAGGNRRGRVVRQHDDAYHWLTTAYRPGDRIALLGFSRGAFTA